MTHRTRAAAVLLVLTVACSGDTAGAKAFCDAARALAKIKPGDTEQTLSTFERMRAEAPDEIKDAINTLADSAKEAFAKGDSTIVQSQAFLDASHELDTYLEGNCKPPGSD
jgi:hypothetical protein